MTRRRRLLWVAPSAPDHEGGGDQQRQAYLLDTVAAEFETHLVVAGTVTDPRIRGSVASVTEVARHPAPLLDTTPRRWARMARHVLSTRLPWHVDLARPQRRVLRRALRQRLHPDDTVVVAHLELAPLIADLGYDTATRPGRQRWVLDLHLSHARQAAHQADVAERVRVRWFWRLQARRARHLERRMASAYDALTTVSDLDASVVAGDCVVINNGVDLDAFTPTPLPGAPNLVMTGSLDYGPNIDGLVWFVDQVWPRVRAEAPRASIAVVGRRPPRTVHRLNRHAGITVHPDVPGIQPYLEDARVAVVPLRLGGGTRLKALQALAAGRPVVGTAVGLEGLGLEDGVHAMVADRPGQFADAVVDLLRDDELARRLAAAGRRLVAAQYGWPALGRRFVDRALVAPATATSSRGR